MTAWKGGQNPDRHETVLITREDPTRAWCNVCGGKCEPGAWCACCQPVFTVLHPTPDDDGNYTVSFPPDEWECIVAAGGARLEVTE